MPEGQLNRLNLIETLYSKGFSSTQISDHLNTNNIPTPTGLLYNPQIVWVSHDKYQKRKQRIDATFVSVEQDYFYVKETSVHENN